MKGGISCVGRGSRIQRQTDKNHDGIFDPLKGIMLLVRKTVNIVIRLDLESDLRSDLQCIY